MFASVNLKEIATRGKMRVCGQFMRVEHREGLEALCLKQRGKLCLVMRTGESCNRLFGLVGIGEILDCAFHNVRQRGAIPVIFEANGNPLLLFLTCHKILTPFDASVWS